MPETRPIPLGEPGSLVPFPHPLIREMFNMLPIPGSDWPLERRVAWLRTLTAMFDLLYGTTAQIEVVLKSADGRADQSGEKQDG